MKILALDFGGSAVKYGLVDENAVITEAGKLPAPLSSKKEFVDTVSSLYEKYKSSIAGIGISLPGNIDPDSGILYGNGVYQELYGSSIIELVQEGCGRIPAAAENDGKCGALAEAWHGALEGCKDGAVIVLGSGIAGGLIKDGKIHSGRCFNAGEFSYLITMPGEYNMYSGAFMAVGMLGVTYKLCKLKNLDFTIQDSSPSMLMFDRLFASRYPAPVGEPKKVRADGKQFFAWIREKDPDALAVYDEFIRALAVLVFNTQICYAPERIVIGGGISVQDMIFTDLDAELDKYYTGVGLGEKMRPQVVRSVYLQETNLYGAAYNFLIRNS